MTTRLVRFLACAAFLSEWFVIDNNRIRSIYSAMFYPSSEAPVPNWPPCEGNWPLPSSLAPAPALAR